MPGDENTKSGSWIISGRDVLSKQGQQSGMLLPVTIIS